MKKPRRIASEFPFVAAFDEVREGLPGAPLAWVEKARREGLRRFADEALPSRRVEEWKYTDLHELAKTAFRLPEGPVSPAVAERVASVAPRAAHRLAVLNGRYDAASSHLADLPAGVHLMSVSDALAHRPEMVKAHMGRLSKLDGDGLLALNAAFMMDGFVLVLEDGASLEEPVEIVFAGDGGAGPVSLHPRNLVALGEGARAAIVETHIGSGVYWSNPVTEVRMAAGSSLRHYKVQDESREAFHLAQTRIALADGSDYRAPVLSLGGRLSRQTFHARLEGRDAFCGIAGAYLVGGGQHGDITTVVEHASGHSRSRQVFKGVLDGDGHGVFQGKVVVARDAQKTDAHQLNNALLLSDGAQIDAKPELEIFADDVKCSHGATAGEIDENELFYLRARGIDADEARRLLVSAFVRAAFDEIEDEAMRQRFVSLVEERLRSGDV